MQVIRLPVLSTVVFYTLSIEQLKTACAEIRPLFGLSVDQQQDGI
jgi:hypothetical protein